MICLWRDNHRSTIITEPCHLLWCGWLRNDFQEAILFPGGCGNSSPSSDDPGGKSSHPCSPVALLFSEQWFRLGPFSPISFDSPQSTRWLRECAPRRASAWSAHDQQHRLHQRLVSDPRETIGACKYSSQHCQLAVEAQISGRCTFRWKRSRLSTMGRRSYQDYRESNFSLITAD